MEPGWVTWEIQNSNAISSPSMQEEKYIYLPVISALPLGSTYWLSEIHWKTHSLEYFLMDSVEHGEYNPHSHI